MYMYHAIRNTCKLGQGRKTEDKLSGCNWKLVEFYTTKLSFDIKKCLHLQQLPSPLYSYHEQN